MSAADEREAMARRGVLGELMVDDSQSEFDGNDEVKIVDILSEALSKRDEPAELFSYLYKVYLEERNKDEKILPSILTELNNSEGLDLCELASLATKSGARSFDVVHVLQDAFSQFDVNISSVLKLIECLYESMQGDMAAYMQFRPFEELAVRQPEIARELLDELVEIDKPYVVGYISRLYQAFSRENEKKVHQELLGYECHQSCYVVMAVTDALGCLDYEKKENRSLVESTMQFFEKVETRQSDEIDRILAFSYMSLVDYSDVAQDKIVDFSGRDSAVIKTAVSQAMFRVNEKYRETEWFLKSLFNLSNGSCSMGGLVENIDFILSELVEKSKNWDAAERFIFLWIENSDYVSKNFKFPDLFDSTTRGFLNNRQQFNRFLTLLFNSDFTASHRVASEFLSFCHIHKVHNVILDKEVLKAMDYEDCVFICRKILGYVNDSRQLCILCFSLLDAFPRNKKIKGLVYSLFINHIGDNHPGRALEFLENIVSNTKSVNKTEIASDAIKYIEARGDERRALAKLNELVPSRQKSIKIARETRKVMSSAMEEAQKGSIVSMIASKSILKQGTGWFHYMNGYSDISKLGHYSTEMEIPYSEVSHPVDAAIERFNFRVAKRGD